MRKLACAVAVVMVASLPAFAIDDKNPNEISGFWGYQWPGGDVANHSVFGLSYERLFPESGGWGLMFKLERAGTSFDGAALDVDYLDISGTYTLTWSRAKVYVPFGIGATRSEGPGDASKKSMTAHVGLGYKFAFNEQVGLRVEGRYRFARELVSVDQGKNLSILETTVGIGWSW